MSTLVADVKADSRFIGLMSGTSLDGVDAALVCFTSDGHPTFEGSHFLPFSELLQHELLAINTSGNNEIERSALLANQLSKLYAACIDGLFESSRLTASDITAIGCHGQTIRHRPELGYTSQIGNAALLAELTGITVVSDFRSRDIAAGGEGAPLVPAFHLALFADPRVHRVIINLGGISNVTDLPPSNVVTGFDCGPANLLLDEWVHRHTGQRYDKNGAWASTGQLIPELLQSMLQHPFLHQLPPKSTGRDTFNMAWLSSQLISTYAPADVQATLVEFAARCIVDAINQYAKSAKEFYLCGGGAHNTALTSRLQELLGDRKVLLTDELGIAADWVEAAAFAWLARQTLIGAHGNLPAVTGASGGRVLGAIYPA